MMAPTSPLACAAVISVMLVAGLLAHRENGFFAFKDGDEYVLVLAVASLAMELLDDLDAAWTRAADDPDVRVIVLKAKGKHFSAGHDLKDGGPAPERFTLEDIYSVETRRYLEYTLRWRNVPKPSIAAVQGKCIAGGLMLCWPCDLIVAAENAEFSDPVVHMGIGGVEYHGHTWELGPRKAKEILFTGRALTAEEADKVGMVNQVVPLDELESAAMELAGRRLSGPHAP
jgi:enoyl-CoA hydratase/carnithine racemase